MRSKTSSVDNTKNVHNRSKLAVFVRTVQGLSSNQNEAAINSKSDLSRTALFQVSDNNEMYMLMSFRTRPRFESTNQRPGHILS